MEDLVVNSTLEHARLMEAEAFRKRLKSALELEDWKSRNDYKSVSVLVLYWQEGDHLGFEEEAYTMDYGVATCRGLRRIEPLLY